MIEEQTPSVNIEEVAPPAESEQQSGQQEEVQQVQGPSIGDQEYNWREARRQIDELRRKTEDQDRYIASLQNQQYAPQPDDEDDSLDKLADDDIVTAKQARSLATKMAREVAEETLRQRDASTAEDRLKSKYPDYDSIVTRDNIELLKQQDPELAASLFALSHDPYNQAVAAYKMLKKTGIGEMAKPQPQKARAIENSKKPVSVQSVTRSSAIGDAKAFENGLRMTPEYAAQLRKEMNEAIKGY
jgi:transcriptional regulator of met regulon